MTNKDSAKPSRLGFIKKKFGKGDGLRSLSPLHLLRPKSPRLALNNEDAESSNNTQLITASVTSTAANSKDHPVDSKVSQSNSKRTPVDMCAMADNQLRDDPQKRETMQKYDRLLETQLPPGSKLEPIGTDERRKQALDFFNSEIERLNAIDTTR
jgi:hypothetical protein